MRTLFLLSLVFIILSGCASEKLSPAEVVRENYRAMETEDIQLYRKTVTGARESTADTLLVMFFNEYDVAYSIDSIETIGELGDIAQVRTVVTATDRGGPNKFHDNRMVAIHKLRLDRGKWKIFYSEIEKPTLLEKVEVAAE